MSVVPAIHIRSEYVLEAKVAGVQSRHNYHKFSHSPSCHVGSPLKIIAEHFSKYSMQSLLRAPANYNRISASESCFHFDSFFHTRVSGRTGRLHRHLAALQRPRCQASWGPSFEDDAIGAEHGEGFATFRSRGPLRVDVDYLNDRMEVRGLQRIRFAMRPDEAFGLIYSLDNVLADTGALRWEAWQRLVEEEGHIVDASEGKGKKFDAKRALVQVRGPSAGVREWLAALHRAGVPCAVASSLNRLTLLPALQRWGIANYFRASVTEEDGMESIAHSFLSAAVKLDRPPSKCVVFEDDPRGIAAGHNCSMKVVALIGQHPAYELTQADLAVSSFADLSVINLRRLFAARGAEFMDLQKQFEDAEPPKRKIRNDTMF